MTAANHRHKIRELPLSEQPAYRAEHYGMAALSNSELIQLITSFTYFDTATNLIQKAGGRLSNLAQMSLEEIQEVTDIGPAAAKAIKAAFELGRRQQLETDTCPQIVCPNDAANLLMLEIGHLDQEHYMVLLLDTKNRVIGKELVYKGTVNTIQVRLAEIFKAAVRKNATAIIVAHNHPSGDPTPSPEDVSTTQLTVEAGLILGIEVLDHVIVGHNRWVSLKERQLGFN